jgi:hypothetical protein
MCCYRAGQAEATAALAKVEEERQRLEAVGLPLPAVLTSVTAGYCILQAHSVELQAVQQRVHDLEAECAKLRSGGYTAIARDGDLSGGNMSRKERHAEPDFVKVSVVTRQQRSQSRHDEESFSSVSPASDMSPSGLHLPPRHELHSAAGAGQHLGGSSWAMVASTVSGQGSVLSSGHPSNHSFHDARHPKPHAAEDRDGVVASPGALDDVSEFRVAPSADSLLFISQVCAYFCNLHL